MAKRAKNSGYTLMEVLAAIMLIAIIMPVAMHAISLAVQTGDVAKYKAEAATLAQSKMHELIATRDWQNGVLNGDFGLDHPEFHWVAELRSWDTSPLQQLDLRVIWTAGGREHQIDLSTLVNSELY